MSHFIQRKIDKNTTLFNEKKDILPLYSTKNRQKYHFIQRKIVKNTTLFNEKL